MRQRKKILLAWITAALLIVGSVNLIPVRAVGETGNEYIIKYKESAAWLMADDSVPFEVVGEGTMKRLRFLGLLEWY